ncbi:regulatory protein [uncultured phage cr131_1]|uniref:Regulatory protein n=1 Tax=uncultured phage cr131_1 TaxID=2772093 RepID=A0A7M1RXH7_9CAUD|nr:regulatory protein [uncultured phage cr131_1]QOR57730.1 regulatory protein [uncultured phage cr131_1]
MAKKNTTPTPFDDLLNSVYGNEGNMPETTNMDAQDTFTDVVEDDDKPADKPAEDNSADDTNPSNTNDDDSEIPQDVLDRMDGKPKDEPIQEPANATVDNTEDVQEPSDADVHEAQQVGLLFDAIGESFGWNMDDVKEEDRPLTVDDLTHYMREVVQQNSVPQYADERIQQLDEYVKNGGKFEDFYGKQQQSLSYDNMDMEDEDNQKAVVSELLRYSGYTDDQIKNKISRYEDADMLEEESADALDRLKLIKQHELEMAQLQQAAYLQQQEEQSKQFYDDCMNQIKSLSSIRGVQIPKEDRAKLADYIFNVDQNGVSKFQRDYNNKDNFINNLLTTAYITMKGDSFISTAKRDGESSATEKLRKMLRHLAKNHTAYNVEDKPKSVVDLASRFF